MLQPMESTYQGYISSTHDALLVFECVRRGVLPKIKRRLREEERKLIRSGQVFVFDERESGIKRWTDGLVWSPSRILWNFLVYRQVDKKFSGRPGTAQKALEGETSETAASGLPSNESTSQSTLTSEYDPYALGVTTSADSALYSASIKATSSAAPQARPGSASNAEISRNRSISSVSDSFTNWVGIDAANGEGAQVGSMPSQRLIEEERSLVGSLKSSYPFAKGGLCKKTISINVDGTTQHLISYYSVEDVRSGRLRTPSSLPEIASLTISPLLLTKTSFRFPPTIHTGPDGIPRFRGEDGYKIETGSTLIESSGEGNSSGSESRYTFYRSDPTVMRQHYSQPAMLPTGSSGMGGRLTSTSMMEVRLAPMAPQVGGSGIHRPSQRSPNEISGKARRSFEPYPKRASLKSNSDESIIPPSPSSAHSAHDGFSSRRLDGLPDPHHQVGHSAYYPHSTDIVYSQSQSGLSTVASGLTINAEDGLNPYKEEEESRQRLMDDLLAEQIDVQETEVPWQTPSLQQEQLRHKVMGDMAAGDPRWTHSFDSRPMAMSRSEDSTYATAHPSYGAPYHYTPIGQSWSNTASISQPLHSSFGYEHQTRHDHQQLSSRPIQHQAYAPSSQEEATRRQHLHNQAATSNTPSFVVSAPTDGVRAALAHSSSYNRSTPPSYHHLYKTHSLPSRPMPVNKGREDALPLA